MTVTIIALLAASTMLSSCLTIMATPGHLMPETTEEKCAQGPHCVWLVSVYEALKDRDEASHLSEQGKFNEAKEAWRKQIALYDRTMGPDYAYTATSYWALGNITRQQGRLEESGVYYEQALGIMEKAHGPNHIDVATALDLLADVYTDDHRYREAEPLYQRALKIRESYVGASRELAQIFTDSVLHLYFDPAPYRQATGVAEDVDKLARLFHEEGRDAEAEPYYLRALAAHEKILNGWFLKYWGTTSYPRANLHSAEDSYASTLENLGGLYRREKRYKESESLCRRALDIEEKARGKTSPQAVAAVLELAETYDAEGRYADAEQLFRRGRAFLENDFFDNGLAHALQKQGKLAEARPLYEKARLMLMASRNVSSEYSQEAGRERRQATNETVHLRDYATLLADIARHPPSDRGKDSPDGDAFMVLDEARGGEAQSALAEAEARNVASDQSTSGLAHKVQELRNRHQFLESRLRDEFARPAGDRDAALAAKLQQEMLDLDRQMDSATAQLLSAFPKYVELTAPAPIDYSGVQRLLGYDEALVSYYVLDDRLLIWLVRPDRPVLYRDYPIKKESLKAMVTRLRATLKRDQPFDVVDAHDLYDLLLQPLEKSLSGVRYLIVVPDDTLLPLPFPTLITSSESDAYKALAEDYRVGFAPSPIELEHDYPRMPWFADAGFAVSTLPSATSLRALRSEGKIPPGKIPLLVPNTEPFIGVGDPLLDGAAGARGGAMLATRGAEAVADIRKLPRLPGAHDELVSEARALGADPQTALFTEERATRSSVMSLNDGRLAHTRVIAFATHALIGGELQGLKEPALVLTPPRQPSEEDNGLLTIDDILRLKLDYNEWVILSACNTAAADGSGEGLSGLARAFFYAGAPSLLVSQWSVDDKATQRLMTNVLRAYGSSPKTSRAWALQTGMQRLMAEEAKGEYAYFAHPYAWAPFFIVGEGGPAAR
jgi:CHAT domain-containing protein